MLVCISQADVPTAVSLQSILILNNFLPDINAYFHFQVSFNIVLLFIVVSPFFLGILSGFRA